MLIGKGKGLESLSHCSVPLPPRHCSPDNFSLSHPAQQDLSLTPRKPRLSEMPISSKNLNASWAGWALLLRADVFPLPGFPDTDLSQPLYLHPSPKGTSGLWLGGGGSGLGLMQEAAGDGAKKQFPNTRLSTYLQSSAPLNSLSHFQAPERLHR